MRLRCRRGAYCVDRRLLILGRRLAREGGHWWLGRYAAEVIRRSRLDCGFLALMLNVDVQTVYSIKEGRRREGGRKVWVRDMDDAFVVLALRVLGEDTARLARGRE